MGLANHTVLIRKDGSECPIDDSAAPIRDERAHVSGCVLIFRDVTAQRRIEREKPSQLLTARLLASIVESSEIAIVSKSLDGIIQSWNAGGGAAFRLHSRGGRRPPHLARHSAGAHRGGRPDHREAEGRQARRAFETERVRADGQRIAVSLTISPIRDDDGQRGRRVEDRARHHARAAGRGRAQKFVTLIESSTDFIGMCDLEGVPIFVNRAGLTMVGLDSIDARAPRHAVRSSSSRRIRRGSCDEFFPAVLRRGHGEIEVRFRHFKTGEARWMAYKVLALRDEAGEPIAVATVSQDVTERKRARGRLAQPRRGAVRRRTAARTSSSRRWRTSCATRSRRSRNVLELWKRAGDAPAARQRARTRWSGSSARWCGSSTICSI